MRSVSRPFLLTLVCAAGFFILVSAAFPISLPVEAQRNKSRGARIKGVKELPAKSKRWALVIGVDEYEEISPLSGATNDAKALADALTGYAGFPRNQVILLASNQPVGHQPTHSNILQYLSNLKRLPEDGLLLVSFAGHGIELNGRGFLCPSDARTGNLELLEATAISVETVHKWIHDTGVKQVLILLDACRNNPSGRGEAQNPLTDSFVRRFNFGARNREVTAFATLYATEVGQVAYEYKEKKQGYFSWTLVEGLKGGAANERGEVTLGGLVKYLQEEVPKQVRLDLGQERTQKPIVKIEGYKADELVISIATERTKPVDWAVESQFWASIADSVDADDFEAYLEKFPDGSFARLARTKIKKLNAASNPTATTSTGLGGLPLRTFEFDTVTVNSRGIIRDRRKGQARYFTEDLRGGVTLDMVEVPEGKFLMGAPDDEVPRYQPSSRERPKHSVTVPAFYMGKYEVTQAQWRAVARLPRVNIDLASDPSKFKGDNLPVDQVSFDDAVEFCERLSRATGRQYRLPSEAEWEYACRAGTTTPFAFGETITPELANYHAEHPYALEPKAASRGGSVDVGSTGYPNGFGLFDMHGNVEEVCLDNWHESYDGAPADASPWEGGNTEYTVLRGGSWARGGGVCRSVYRGPNWVVGRRNDVGFRVVISVRAR